MQNKIDFKSAKVALNSKAQMFKLADLDPQKPEDAEIIQKIQEAGETKGLTIAFKEGEVVVFPSDKDAHIVVEGFELNNGKIRTLLSVVAWSERKGFFVFPLSVTRRIPVDDIVPGSDKTDQEILFENNELGEKLAQRQSDYNRLTQLLGKEVKISARLNLHQGVVEWDEANKQYRRKEGAVRTLVCYKYEYVQ